MILKQNSSFDTLYTTLTSLRFLDYSPNLFLFCFYWGSTVNENLGELPTIEETIKFRPKIEDELVKVHNYSSLQLDKVGI